MTFWYTSFAVNLKNRYQLQGNKARVHMHLAISNIQFAYSYASSYASSSPSFCPLSYASSYAATLIHSRIRILIKEISPASTPNILFLPNEGA